MKKLFLIVVAIATLLHPLTVNADPATYWVSALKTQRVEVAFWYGHRNVPTGADVVIKNAKAGKAYTVKLTYWMRGKWSKVQTIAKTAKRDGEMLFFSFPLRGIKRSVVKVKINGKLYMVAR